ncbi:biotin-dependent carboxyltransferase family protein [Herbiconiux sp. L3-i23]|uniref:5-oxoprolinase subunit C family protein n=1 Tax=Herbiconiux sp. L3-i23 TaxID=2905871 RepID=UPI00206616F5|nr:biotin-dependent carboxyltransferase family protein [Herbiconiux sp. L3-i23]BDI23777.1 allophanate hydrolase [Herbiconiux sp. L3-i23]
MNRLTVLEPGALLVVQDVGRPGLAHLGVGTSGAFDRAAHALGNRLVGNAADAASLESLLGGAALVFDEPTWVAITGAWGEITAGGMPVEPHTATLIPARTPLSIATVGQGIRYTIAVRGGVDVAPVLGSRSWDSLAQLGPAPLVAGQSVPVGAEPAIPVPAADLIPIDPPGDGTIELELRPGPRREWFDDAAWSLLTSDTWEVSPRSDRTGIRLIGATLERRRLGELPSEGMVPGAIQVSPDGAPTILGVDAPVTGGYPVIAVVTDATLDRLAQLRPGQRVRFRVATGHS